MSIRTHTASKNRESILNTVFESKQGVTIKDVSEIHSINYYTARLYLLGLLEDGKIDTLSETRNKATVFIRRDYSKMPKIGKTPIWKYLTMLVNPPGDERPANMVHEGRTFPLLMVRLFDEARKSSLSTPQTPVAKTEMRAIRADLMKILENVDKFKAAIEMILNNHLLWETPASLEDVLMGDPETPVTADEIQTTIQRHIQRYNATKGQL